MRKTQTRGKASRTRRQETAKQRAAVYASLTPAEKDVQQALNHKRYTIQKGV